MEKPNSSYLVPVAIVLAGIIITLGIVFQPSDAVRIASERKTVAQTQESNALANSEVYPREGVVLPVTWGDLGKELAYVGAIDGSKFKKLYSDRGSYTDEYDKLLNGNSSGNLKITRENAGFLLNLFWALGLSNQNKILTDGEMSDPRYGGADRFASTGGWIMAQGDAMNHYSRHKFFNLTTEQQNLVEKVSKGIYRPCCGNSTHFPDCNHGTAMLGLLELMASQGVSEEEMWKAALAVNSYWFPDTYVTLATYMKSKGITWENVDPQEILGATFSSASGFSKIASQVKSPAGSGGTTGCGVDIAPSVSPKKESGCGI